MRRLPAGAEALAEAAAALGRGEVVAYPTETFYALGVRYDDPEALRRLFALKGREEGKAVSLILGSEKDLSKVADEPDFRARGLMRMYWPGALTLVLKAREGLPPLLLKDGTVAVRVPGESFALELAAAAGFPITATSANPAGMPPPVDADRVREYFPEGVDLLVDGGTTPGGEPSTIAAVAGEKIRVIREGAVDIA